MAHAHAISVAEDTYLKEFTWMDHGPSEGADTHSMYTYYSIPSIEHHGDEVLPIHSFQIRLRNLSRHEGSSYLLLRSPYSSFPHKLDLVDWHSIPLRHAFLHCEVPGYEEGPAPG